MARDSHGTDCKAKDVVALAPLRQVRRVERYGVLRYWLEAVRYEESILARPRARRPKRREHPLDLAAPGSGQTYYRLGAEHADFFLLERAWAEVGLDDGVTRFLEHTLRSRYRNEARPSSEFWLAGWPVLYFGRKEELAPLFRFPVAVTWRIDDRAWSPPSGDDLRRGAIPPPPTAVRAEQDGEAPALSLNTALVNRELGVVDEDLQALSARWERSKPSARQMVRDLLSLLDPTVKPASLEHGALFTTLVRAIAGRTREGTSVHPVGIVQDSSLFAPTQQLQRELAALMGGEVSIAQPGALASYLTGERLPNRRKPLFARRHARGLTDGQRAAAETFLGSTLSAVQGPPGTGKTELILDLAAHAIVARADRLERSGAVSEGMLVVASTNNRAVDNVLDPLSADPDRLALGIRAGNREVTFETTLAALRTARAWLEAQAVADPKARLRDELDLFRAARAEWARASRPEQIRMELASLAVVGTPLSKHERALLRRGDRFLALLEALEAILEDGGKKPRVRLERRWKRSFEPGFADLSGALPPMHADVGSWEDGIASARVAVEEVIDALRVRERATEDAAKRQRLQDELQSLESSGAEVEHAAHLLYLAAVRVREAWALVHRTELLEALDAAATLAAEHRSLRRALSNRKVRSWIYRLFPVVGSTLLSLGNVFALSPGEIELLVIDEAGQCHPAHAVSGLARAERALLIGDVHQLPPVVQLSAQDEERVLWRANAKMKAASLEPYRVGAAFTTSAQSIADRAAGERLALTDHFRCQPEIIALCDRLCGYRFRVHTPVRSLSHRTPLLPAPVVFRAIDGRQQARHGSWYNRAELDAVLALLDGLAADGIPSEELAVLTPYVAQLELLRAELRRAGVPFQEEQGEGIATGTVHRFQGGERTVVLFSTVVTETRSLPFLDAQVHLLNVAISRARDHLVIVGHAPTLASGNRTRVLMEGAGFGRGQLQSESSSSSSEIWAARSR